MHQLPRFAGYLKALTTFAVVGCVASAAFGAPEQDSAHRAQPADRPQSTGTISLEEWIHRMPEIQLRKLYLRCARASEQRRLDGDEMFACSVGQEALLARYFRGDFEALQAWSSKQLASTEETAQRSD